MLDIPRLKSHMSNGEIEYVMCSANWIDDDIDYSHKPYNIDKGLVFGGIRHGSIFEMTQRIYPHDEYGNKTIQGFLTTKNRFLNREDALELVKSNGQLKKELLGSELQSEDLW